MRSFKGVRLSIINIAISMIICSVGSFAVADVIFVSGDVSGTWSADSVIVSDSIYISPGNTLVIQPGVEVLFVSWYYFTVNQGAVLHAVGTETDSISFLSLDDNLSTLGIDFLNASDESIMEYCYMSEALYGAISLTSTGMTIRNCLIDSCSGYTSGGAILVMDSSRALIEGNTIRGNESNAEGGAVYCENSSPIIRGNIFESNSTGSEGGAIYCEGDSYPEIMNNLFINNRVNTITFPPFPGRGGAIYFTDGSDPVITGNQFFNNRVGPGAQIAFAGGGAIASFSGHPLIANNLFVGNQATSDNGGAIFIFNSGPTMINNVFVNNSAGDYGGSIYAELGPASQLTNSILYGNTAPDGPEIYLEDVTMTVTYSDVQGGWQGEGNIDVDPLFRNPSAGNYHLMSTACGDPFDSPCIDAGSPDYIDTLLNCSWGLGTDRSDMGAYGGGEMIPTAIDDEDIAIIATGFQLTGNYPNPFNASTAIRYNIPFTADIALEIYDLMGRKIETLYNGNQRAGNHTIIWHANDYPSGVYFYRLRASGFSQSAHMTLLK